MAWTKTLTTKDGERRYKVFYYDPSGAQRSKTFTKSEDARRFERTIEVRKDEGEYLDPKDARERLSSVYARFMDMVEVEPTTRSKRATVWAIHVAPRLGNRPINAITKNMVTAVRDAPESPWQGNEAVRLVKRLLYFAVDDGILTRNVAARIEPRRVERKEIEILKPHELAGVLAALDEQWRAMVLLDALGALRWSELVGLRVEDVDLKRVVPIDDREVKAPAVHIRQKITEVAGEFHVGPPKTQGSARTVELPTVVVVPLAEYLLKNQPGPGGLIFHENGHPIARKRFGRVWARALRDAGTNKHVRVGWLRHSGASIAYAATRDLKATAQRLGHTSTRMVDTTYLKLYAEATRDVVNAIDRVMGQVEG